MMLDPGAACLRRCQSGLMVDRDDHERRKYRLIDHNLRRDFGVDPDKIRQRFAFFFERAAVVVEAR
jgi:hypothetical protein